jgi:glycosyltransferase involved in cell wall biosynthesis
VIKRTLTPLSRAAVEGFIELIVVCNGCTDNSADVARSVPGVQVLELEQASKPAALNVGDDVATLWPRLYLDADVQISAEAVIAVLDRLAQGDVSVAHPRYECDSRGASALVRSYYRPSCARSVAPGRRPTRPFGLA